LNRLQFDRGTEDATLSRLVDPWWSLERNMAKASANGLPSEIEADVDAGSEEAVSPAAAKVFVDNFAWELKKLKIANPTDLYEHIRASGYKLSLSTIGRYFSGKSLPNSSGRRVLAAVFGYDLTLGADTIILPGHIERRTGSSSIPGPSRTTQGYDPYAALERIMMSSPSAEREAVLMTLKKFDPAHADAPTGSGK
jgi:hypothetical protein